MIDTEVKCPCGGAVHAHGSLDGVYECPECRALGVVIASYNDEPAYFLPDGMSSIPRKSDKRAACDTLVRVGVTVLLVYCSALISYETLSRIAAYLS